MMLFLQDSQSSSSLLNAPSNNKWINTVYTIYTNLTFYKDHADLHLYRQQYFTYSLFIHLFITKCHNFNNTTPYIKNTDITASQCAVCGPEICSCSFPICFLKGLYTYL